MDRRTDGQTDDERQAIREKLTWASGSGELKRTEDCINALDALLQKISVFFPVDTSIIWKKITDLFLITHFHFISTKNMVRMFWAPYK